MKKIAFSVFFVVFVWVSGRSQQTDCSNIGFELGSTLGWVLTNGTVTDANSKTIYSAERVGSIENEHLITKLSDGNDPKITTEQIPMVAPGSNYSIRIGNTTRGTRFDRIKTSFLVTPDNTLFQYQFAVVLQNDTRGHESYQKPGFSIQITDKNGKELTCSFFDVQLLSSGSVTGFKIQGDLEYRNWTKGAIDLRNYIGQTINIEVSAHGCTKQSHFGYAYFDAQCLKSEVEQPYTCPDADGYLTLKAPDGFGKYTWNTGETTPTLKVKAKLGDKYFVKLLPIGSLNDQCELQLDYTLKYQNTASTITTTLCEGEKIVVGDETYQKTGKYVKVINRAGVCDSTVTLNLTVNPIIKHSQTISICAGENFKVGDETYNSSGIYNTIIKRPAKCDSIVTTNLTVHDFDISIASKDSLITLGDSLKLNALITPAGTFSYQWSSPVGLSCASCPETWIKPTETTKYTVLVTKSVCSKSKFITIKVLQCSTVYAPEAFSPNNDQENDVFFVYGAKCVKQIKEMSIFNRWGENIFFGENFPPSNPKYGWDGTFQGQIVDTGIYTYRLFIELNDGKLIKNEGAITLLR
ncbi:gliding motility-associated C-terminal domain-containing protein [Emticicia sp. SJ17W-69]|uniref:T9SS type B sorting domain-containing protein n=1 Tax=Emticicia sp. SJ17W-69 TaxID=3421657 RepID=UPI003EBA0C09